MSSIYPIFDNIKRSTIISREQYDELYDKSITDPDEFWSQQASTHLDWFKPWDRTSNCDFSSGQVKWFEGGKLNVSHTTV